MAKLERHIQKNSEIWLYKVKKFLQTFACWGYPSMQTPVEFSEFCYFTKIRLTNLTFFNTFTSCQFRKTVATWPISSGERSISFQCGRKNTFSANLGNCSLAKHTSMEIANDGQGIQWVATSSLSHLAIANRRHFTRCKAPYQPLRCTQSS